MNLFYQPILASANRDSLRQAYYSKLYLLGLRKASSYSDQLTSIALQASLLDEKDQ